MPTVPRLQRSVSTAPLPDTSLRSAPSEDAFGAAVARGTNAVARTASDIYVAEQQRANEQALFEAGRKLNEWELANVYDPVNGAVAKRGRNAFDLPRQLDDNLAKSAEGIEGGLGNEVQREAFRRMLATRRQQVQEFAQRHEGREREVFYQEQFEADLESSKEIASADPARAEAQIAVQRQRTLQHLRDRGLPAEAIAQELQRHETDTHGRVITAMLGQGQDQAAKEYYARVRERMDPDARPKLDAWMKDAEQRGEGRRISAELYDSHATLSEALETLEKRDLSDEVYDETKARLRERFALKRQAEEEQAHKRFDDAADIVEQDPSRLDDLRRNPAVWQELTIGERRSLETRADQILFDRKPKDGSDAYLELRRLAAVSPDAFSDTRLSERRHELSDGDYARLQEFQADIEARRTNASAKPSKTFGGILTVNQVVDGTLRQIKLDPERGVGSSNPDERVVAFERQLDRAVAAEQAVKQRELEAPEVQAIADRLITEEVISTPRGTFSPLRIFDSTDEETIRAFQRPGADRFVASPAQIPANKQKDNIDALTKALKRAPTDDEIVENYNTTIARQTPNAQ